MIPTRSDNILLWRLIIFSTAILTLLLIQEGQLSVSGNRMCTSTGQKLRRLSLLKKCVVRQSDQLGMFSVVLTGLLNSNLKNSHKKYLNKALLTSTHNIYCVYGEVRKNVISSMLKKYIIWHNSAHYFSF